MSMTEEVDLADGVYSGESIVPAMVRMPLGTIVASAIPVKPPRAWFDDPQLSELTPMTIESSGRVFGHIAGWKQDHIGLNGRIRAPHSRSDYAFYATGVLETDDGTMVNVGQITLVGGHAPLEASVAEAVAHYDNTQSGMIDVAIGEDRHGIWAAGALRPEVDELSLRRLRASGVSGDWRPINGALELVAVCSVNVPGFPIPRARVAAGVPVALVAAGTSEIVSILMDDHAHSGDHVTAALGSLDARLRLMEDAVLGRTMEHREALVAAVEQAREDQRRAALRASVAASRPPVDENLLASLRARAHPAPAEPDTEALAASLRARIGVWDDGMPLEFSFADCEAASQTALQASLRARAHGEALVAAPKTWSAEERRKAKGKKQTLPDGSFPIANKADWYRARQSIGRAKNRAAAKRHIISRAKSLGIPAKEYANL